MPGVHNPADYLKPELTAETQPKPDFTDFLDKVKRGQASLGKDRAVPIVLGAPQQVALQAAVYIIFNLLLRICGISASDTCSVKCALHSALRNFILLGWKLTCLL